MIELLLFEFLQISGHGTSAHLTSKFLSFLLFFMIDLWNLIEGGLWLLIGVLCCLRRFLEAHLMELGQYEAHLAIMVQKFLIGRIY